MSDAHACPRPLPPFLACRDRPGPARARRHALGRRRALHALPSHPLALLAFIGAAACAGQPVEPPTEPVAVATPVLRFVGVCDRPAIWWLRREPETEVPTMWLFLATDSLDFRPDPTFTGLRWMELDALGTPLALGGLVLDSLGAGRLEVACVPGDTTG